MLFFVALGVTALVALIITICTTVGTLNKEKNKLYTFVLTFAQVFAVIGAIFFVIFIIISAMAQNYSGDKQEVTSTVTYTIANNTKLDTSEAGVAKFISVRPDMYLEPVEVTYSTIQVDGFEQKKVIVEHIDHSHTWLYPWVFNGKNKVTLQ
jgi:hypothetical protein